MNAASLPGRFAEHLDATGLLAGPGLALLAVSGGSDSLALLDLVAGVAEARALRLLVVHADHGIHPDSHLVAAHVWRIATERYAIEPIVEPLRLGAGASETRAREARYEFFRRIQAQRDARWLVTGHHADDQAETVLLRLLRGSAPAGLAGIQPAGPQGLVRPLLPFRRAQLAAHVRALGLDVVDDPANADRRHTRSWVRGALLPVLTQRLGDEAVDALLSVARHAADELAAWDAVLDVLAPLDLRVGDARVDVARAPLRGYDSHLAARVLRAAARRAGLMLAPAQAARVVRLAADAASGRMADLGEDTVAEVAFDRLVIRRVATSPDARALAGASGDEAFGGFRVAWRLEPAPERLDRGGWTTWIEPGALEVRLPPPGTRLIPLGGVGHRPVTKLLMEVKIPRGDRAGWPLILRNGEPVWVPGVCRANTAIPVPGSNAVRMDVAAR